MVRSPPEPGQRNAGHIQDPSSGGVTVVTASGNKRPQAKYLVVSPVRNEAQYIEGTIRSMACQTVPPAEWIIVNDGSTDETAELVKRHARSHAWIHLIDREKRQEGQDRQRGKGVIDTFYYGYERRTEEKYQFLVKLDGDVSFEPEYFEFLLQQFAANARLGIAGGTLYEQLDNKWTLRTALDHVRGPIKTYRRACFDEIGGLERALGWDGIDEWKARSQGWEVRSFAETRVYHHRPTGDATGKLKAKMEQGYGAHYMGYHPLYTIARGILHMTRRPYVLGGMTMMLGHLAAWMQGREQYGDRSVLRYVRRTQRRQLAGLLIGQGVHEF